MQIKKYLEADMRRAMRRVSEELGPDAVIISSGRQGDLVEVVAALDYDESLVQEVQAGKELVFFGAHPDDEGLVGPLLAFAADYSGTHGRFQFERAANGNHPIANLQLIGIAKSRHG